MRSPTRQQPQRAVRDNCLATLPTPSGRARGGVKKATTGVEPKSQNKRGGKCTKGAQAKAIKELENRVSAMEPEISMLEQRALFGLEVDPHPVPPTPTPKLAKGKRGRPKKKKKKKKSEEEDMYMDDFILSDEENAANKGEGEAGDRLNRGDRWIPDIEHRSRPAWKPKGVPYQMWMSYCLLDDYIYRYSLTDGEVMAYPLMDEVYSFQNGGPQPVTPAGFQWNDKKKLVPTT
ncbi:hypothetical protein F4819DRAFT_504657 [Hypoxylon fuscum]|nr:hypothetical protein F4819DRAFT_504657 [Hypoxylon fuscum]